MTWRRWQAVTGDSEAHYGTHFLFATMLLDVFLLDSK
jgi:hypothetical protein